MRLKILFIPILFLHLGFAHSAKIPIKAQMQSTLDKAVIQHNVRGISAAVVFPDVSIWAGTSGMSHDTVAMKPDMLFAIGSVTKNVVAALTLQLVEEKLLSLEDPLSKWLPAYPHVDSTITIRQLLNHTSGIYMFWSNQKIWDDLKKDRSKIWTPEEVLSYIKEPYFSPGDGFRYSNTNYLLLAMIITKVTGSTLSSELQNRFWKPLDIKNAFLSIEQDIPDNQAHVFGDNFNNDGSCIDLTFLPRESHDSITYGSSGLFMSATDLARWCFALFEGKVVSSKSLNEMQQFVKSPSLGKISSSFERKTKALMEKGNLPSLQMAVVFQDSIVWSKAYGDSADVNHLYMNGSVQKVFDATAILQLYEKGLIDLDADVSSYLSFDVKHPDDTDIPISIRLLLAHRSGLGDFAQQFLWDTEGIFSKESSDRDSELIEMSLEEYIRASINPDGSNFQSQTWPAKPGERYHYSVSAYPLLRHLIEKVTGESYPEYMRKNIFLPLDMATSGFRADEFPAQHSIPYTRSGNENDQLPVWSGNGYMMRTTAEDMAKFMIAHMNNGRYKDYQVLTPETISIMRKKESHGKSLLNRKSELYDPAYGLGIIHYRDHWLGHGGSTVGYQTLWQFEPDEKIGFTIMTNVSGILGGRDTFLAVWNTVSRIRDELIAELDLEPSLLSNTKVLIWIGLLLIILLANVKKLAKFLKPGDKRHVNA